MCIRDSAYLASFSIAYFLSGCFAFILSSEYDYFNLKKFDKETLKAMLRYSAPNIPNTVSYTHLDVYKRQDVEYVSVALKVAVKEVRG